MPNKNTDQKKDAQSFLNEIRFILSFSNFKRREYVWNILLIALEVIPFCALPILIKIIIDQFIPTGDLDGIYLCLAAALFLSLMNILFHASWQAHLTAGIIKTAGANLQLALIQKLQRTRQEALDNLPSGRIFARITLSTNNIVQFMGGFLGSMINTGIGFLFILLILILINPKLALIITLLVPIFSLGQYFLTGKLRETQRHARVAIETFSQALSLFVQNSLLSRVHGEESFESARVEAHNTKIVSTSKQVIRKSALFGSSVYANNQIAFLLSLGISSWFVIQGNLLIGEMILFVQYMSRLTSCFNAILSQYPQMILFRDSIESIREIWNMPEMPDSGSYTPKETVKGHVLFKNVSFYYPGSSKKVLDNISFEILPGQSIGLVGPSGSGKSTIIRLLLGLYQPTEGEIYIDSIPLSKWNLNSLRKYYGTVSQDTILFSGTVKENITHGRPVLSNSDLVDAVTRAHAYSFINKLPQKFEEIVLENGSNFSGGERQRLAIARALFRKPKLLFLDEATSALDSESEHEVQNAINGLLGGQTAFIVAHRLTTIFKTDCIFIFKDGRITENGSHNALIDLNGDYAELLSTQMKLPKNILYTLKL